jgi:hypothetical protein
MTHRAFLRASQSTARMISYHRHGDNGLTGDKNDERGYIKYGVQFSRFSFLAGFQQPLLLLSHPIMSQCWRLYNGSLRESFPQAPE